MKISPKSIKPYRFFFSYLLPHSPLKVKGTLCTFTGHMAVLSHLYLRLVPHSHQNHKDLGMLGAHSVLVRYILENGACSLFK